MARSVRSRPHTPSLVVSTSPTFERPQRPTNPLVPHLPSLPLERVISPPLIHTSLVLPEPPTGSTSPISTPPPPHRCLLPPQENKAPSQLPLQPSPAGEGSSLSPPRPETNGGVHLSSQLLPNHSPLLESPPFVGSPCFSRAPAGLLSSVLLCLRSPATMACDFNVCEDTQHAQFQDLLANNPLLTSLLLPHHSCSEPLSLMHCITLNIFILSISFTDLHLQSFQLSYDGNNSPTLPRPTMTPSPAITVSCPAGLHAPPGVNQPPLAGEFTLFIRPTLITVSRLTTVSLCPGP